MATTEKQKAACKRYRERNKERLKPIWRARAKTYRECINADPNYRAKKTAYHKTYRAENRNRRMLADAKARAKKGSFPCTIELQDVFIPNECPLLNVPFQRKGPYAPSLDKIIPALGYVPGNVLVISCRANSIKHNATLEELQKLIANLAVLLALRGV